MPDQFLRFQEGFIWGAATSAYQIEGACEEDGRGQSIWDTFCRQPGKIRAGEHGSVAADHYHRWEEDIRLMQELGLNAYRFSIAWPRIFPNGKGEVNQAGLDFYDRLVDSLLARKIEPFITLYHWDLPQALQDEGGWPTRATAYHFAEYALQVANRLGDRVKFWITLNEPIVSAMNGYFLGDHAPGLQDPFMAIQAGHHLLLAHGLGVQAMRSVLPGDAQVGITLSLTSVHPAIDTEKDRQAAKRADMILNRLFLDPIYKGDYPAEFRELFSPLFAMIDPVDLEKISAPIDFLGVNYYSRTVVKHDTDVPTLDVSPVYPEGNEYSQMWEIYPQGLYELLTRLRNDYHPPKIFITENGIPVEDGLDLDGRVRDYRRIRFLRDHLAQMHRAIQDGVPVEGYFVWSLLDNFEWAHGYSKRFGVVYVDFVTQKRIMKDSGRWFAAVTRANSLSPEIDSAFLPDSAYAYQEIRE